jgi:hypothetical protein
LIVLGAFLAIGAVIALVPDLDCGADPDDPCLGSDAWHGIAMTGMLMFLAAGCYLAGRLLWAAARLRPMRYRWGLIVGGVAASVFLGAALVYDATLP